MARILRGIGAMAAMFLILIAAGADSQSQLANDKQALAGAQAYVGQWRGVGQLKRGSSQGAWTEESQWVWHFENGRATLSGELTGDKFFAQLQLQPGDKPAQFVLLATPIEVSGDAKPAPRRFAGAMAGGVLTLVSDEPTEGQPARVSLRLTAEGDRMLVLYEKRVGDGIFMRLAEVGSTRKGSSFAKSTASGPECIVTGGLGTIPVEHQGKKYSVCCTGCRDLFRDDPEGVLKDFRERKAAERAEQEAKDKR